MALATLVSCTTGSDEGTPPQQGKASRPSPEAVQLPPPHAGFDYQIGGAYPPPSGVRIVTRDRSASPAPGLYNICYVNAFQAQPDDSKTWPADLLLRDAQGKVVMDRDWDEAILDIGTPAKRRRVAARVNRWIDGCADKGFDAVEPDNYDSYTRSGHLLTVNDATAFITLLSAHAHSRGWPSDRRTPRNWPGSGRKRSSTSRLPRSAASTTSATRTRRRSTTGSSTSSTPTAVCARPSRAMETG